MPGEKGTDVFYGDDVMTGHSCCFRVVSRVSRFFVEQMLAVLYGESFVLSTLSRILKMTYR